MRATFEEARKDWENAGRDADGFRGPSRETVEEAVADRNLIFPIIYGADWRPDDEPTRH